MIGETIKAKIIEALNARYGSWSGFQDEQFIEDETRYKRRVAEETQPLVARAVLDEMVQQGQWDDFIAQLELAGKRSINLLYMRTPKSGDLKLLYAPALAGDLRAEFCRVLPVALRRRRRAGTAGRIRGVPGGQQAAHLLDLSDLLPVYLRSRPQPAGKTEHDQGFSGVHRRRRAVEPMADGGGLPGDSRHGR